MLFKAEYEKWLHNTEKEQEIQHELVNMTEAEKEDAVVENLVPIIIYIYILKSNIEDKKQKQEEFIDFVAENFSVTDKEYMNVRRMQGIFLNEKDYETFLQKYKGTIEEIVTMIIERDQKQIEENKSKRSI